MGLYWMCNCQQRVVAIRPGAGVSTNDHMEVSIVMGVPLYRWMVYFMENPRIKWMITGGSPTSGNLHILPINPS